MCNEITGAAGIVAPSSLSEGLSLLMNRLMDVDDVTVDDAASDAADDVTATLQLASPGHLLSCAGFRDLHLFNSYHLLIHQSSS